MEMLKASECRSCCPVSNALDVLGDRWTLLVIRDMLFMNKHEYREFLTAPEGIATNILSDRLKRLVCAGIIDLAKHPSHKNKKLYYLTQQGKDLMPILLELVRWGVTYRATRDMPKARFDRMQRNPKKFMQQILQQLAAWEKQNLK